jgi:hypothetical protein
MIKKHVRTTILVMAALLMFSSTVFAAVDYGDFDYWYSDSTKIGYFDPNPLFYCTVSSGFDMGDSFADAISYGVEVWEDLSGLYYSQGSSSNNNIRIQGISRATADGLGVDANAAAETGILSSKEMGYGRYNGSRKTVHAISKARINVVWDDTGSPYDTSEFSEEKWNAILAHEFGHLLGYYGHDKGSTSRNPALMAQSSYDKYGVDSPQDRDYDHLGQVY